MPGETLLVAYDGHDRNALEFGLALARKSQAHIVVAHVLHWSPYSFLTHEEVEQRHRIRDQELDRARTAVLGPLIEPLKAAGVSIEGAARHGQTVDVLCDLARERGASMIVVGRSSSFSSRMFGSVTSALAQESPVPVVIVP